MAAILKFPLEKTSADQLQVLGEALWSWSPRKDCNTINCNGCEAEGCIARRSKRLAQFFSRYKELTSLYEPDDICNSSPALNSHNDLFQLIERLKELPHVSRSLLAQKLFPPMPNHKSPSIADIDRALNLAIAVMFMINCSAQRQAFGILEHGMPQVEWRNEFTLAEFIASIFPMTDHPVINDNDAASTLHMKSSLMAKNLKKVAGLEFRATDDLSCHLKLDRQAGVVEVFHHTAFLKEHLRLTKDLSADISIVDCLKR